MGYLVYIRSLQCNESPSLLDLFLKPCRGRTCMGPEKAWLENNLCGRHYSARVMRITALTNCWSEDPRMASLSKRIFSGPFLSVPWHRSCQSRHALFSRWISIDTTSSAWDDIGEHRWAAVVMEVAACCIAVEMRHQRPNFGQALLTERETWEAQHVELAQFHPCTNRSYRSAVQNGRWYCDVSLVEAFVYLHVSAWNIVFPIDHVDASRCEDISPKPVFFLAGSGNPDLARNRVSLCVREKQLLKTCHLRWTLRVLSLASGGEIASRSLGQKPRWPALFPFPNRFHEGHL